MNPNSLEELMETVKAKVGALIQKPKMTDKLLSKPPFRFLHDTISAIIAATGFGNGLYSAEELDSANISEKQQKIDYLEKIFRLCGICNGNALDVRAAKVIAGLEPENTCMFLAVLADVASNSSIDSATAVQMALRGDEPGTVPIPTHAASYRSESKNDRGFASDLKASKLDDDIKGFEIKNDIEHVAAERGKSRGGTRGSNRPTQNSNSGISSMAEQPSNLYAEIDKCDGSYEITKETLGNLITKPKLADKLLQKPPFRFLHDIIVEVIRTTRFAENLYSEEELDSANVKEKEQKTLFLDKIIKLVGIQLNTLVEAKSAKIVAGLEPQDTNRFLQLLAVAAKNMPDSSKAVRTVHEHFGISVAATTQPPRQESSKVNSTTDSMTKQPTRPVEKEEKHERVAPEKPKPIPENDNKDDEAKRVVDDHQATDEDPGDRGENDGEKRSLRPTTARRKPPKVKENARELTAKDSAPTAKKAEGILIDGQNDDDDEVLVQEEKRLADDGVDHESERNQQSKVVQDILSRRAEQEAVSKAESKADKLSSPEVKVDTSQKESAGIRLGKLRKTGSEKKTTTGVSAGGSDVNTLRKAVQSLVQYTGPLGTCMDYIQEDVGTMTAELHRWEEECRKYEIELDEQKRLTEDKLQSLYRESDDLDERIKEEILKISAIKSTISKNEIKIQQILRFAATS